MSAAVDWQTQEVRRLIGLMRSPAYWRDRDPEIVRTVRTGFKRLYGRRGEVAAGREAGADPVGRLSGLLSGAADSATPPIRSLALAAASGRASVWQI